MSEKLKILQIGCGLIGKRRAEQVIQHADSELLAVVDANEQAAKAVADEFHCPHSTNWTTLLPKADIIIVSTPNAMLLPIAIEALKQNKHVLIEKPMGRNVQEARALCEMAWQSKGLLKIGFNHRYHPALQQLKAWFGESKIGRVINVRVVYGHGGRAGYEKEWRGNLELAGGGELTDQGVHVLDLLQWLLGSPQKVFAKLQTAVWPIEPLEDNAFALLTYSDKAIASIHTSWTQWKNQFLFEMFGERGAIIVNGLGGSYGPESITLQLRNLAGGAPFTETQTFTQPDQSWQLEWEDFMRAILHKTEYYGSPSEGFAVMQTVAALYESHQRQKEVNNEFCENLPK